MYHIVLFQWIADVNVDGQIDLQRALFCVIFPMFTQRIPLFMVKNPFLSKSEEETAKGAHINSSQKKKISNTPFSSSDGMNSVDNDTKKATQEQAHKDDEATVKNFIIEIVKIFVLALVIIVPIRLFIFQPFFVQGDSMLPNFENAQYLIVNEVGYKKTLIGPSQKPFFQTEPWKDLERGEVIVFRAPGNPKEFYIKRVIGLPGETVMIEDGKVKIINKQQQEGFYLDESLYLPPERRTFCGTRAMCPPVVLESDEYFVLGDNRGASNDSRSWGPLQENEVIGIVAVRAWPVTKIQVY